MENTTASPRTTIGSQLVGASVDKPARATSPLETALEAHAGTLTNLEDFFGRLEHRLAAFVCEPLLGDAPKADKALPGSSTIVSLVSSGTDRADALLERGLDILRKLEI